MRRSILVLAVAVCLLGAGSAQAAYESASGGSTAGGYGASITGKSASTDVVLVLDNSGSMANAFAGGGSSKWDALSAATKTYVEQLGASGLFSRGGKVGVVLFSTSTSELAPTSSESAIDQKINEGSPSGESCVSCGLKRAAELLSAIPGSSGHRRLIYLLADGGNTVTPPTVEEALAADNAAGAVRRAIGVGPESSVGSLAALDSDGTVSYAESQQDLLNDYAAETTVFPGATNVKWTFHLSPGVSPSAPTASEGSASVSGSDVVWTIPGLGAETATLSFAAARAVPVELCSGGGSGAGALLAGTSFSDDQGDPAPTVSLGDPGPIAMPACKPKPGDRATISLPKAPKKCWSRRSLTVKVSGNGIAKTVVKVTGSKAKTFTGRSAGGALKVKGLPAGAYKVKVTVTLEDGTKTTAKRAYRGCAPKPTR